MKKSDAERAIRSLCHQWARETGQPVHTPGFNPSFGAFTAWARTQGYGGYFDFRSAVSPMSDAEYWFDQEFRQTWRN